MVCVFCFTSLLSPINSQFDSLEFGALFLCPNPDPAALCCDWFGFCVHAIEIIAGAISRSFHPEISEDVQSINVVLVFASVCLFSSCGTYFVRCVAFYFGMAMWIWSNAMVPYLFIARRIIWINTCLLGKLWWKYLWRNHSLARLFQCPTRVISNDKKYKLFINYYLLYRPHKYLILSRKYEKCFGKLFSVLLK